MSKETDLKAMSDQLQRMERILTATRIKQGVHERVIAALIATHPTLEDFVRYMEREIEIVTSQHLFDSVVNDETREYAHKLAQEFLGVGQDALALKAAQHQPVG